MKKNAGGFTLIELVAVMVILAILAVVAVPQFVNLRAASADSAAAGIGGAIASATALNYARGSAAGGATTIDSTTPCATAGTLLAGGVPTGYAITEDTAPTGSGTTGACKIKNSTVTGTTDQSFTIIGCANATCS